MKRTFVSLTTCERTRQIRCLIPCTDSLARHDQEWLNYQHEIALRHHSTKKNKADGVDEVPIIHYRFMVAFIYPITATIKGFLANKGHDAETVEAMYSDWFKAVTITVILWTYPYINTNEF